MGALRKPLELYPVDNLIESLSAHMFLMGQSAHKETNRRKPVLKVSTLQHRLVVYKIQDHIRNIGGAGKCRMQNNDLFNAGGRSMARKYMR